MSNLAAELLALLLGTISTVVDIDVMAWPSFDDGDGFGSRRRTRAVQVEVFLPQVPNRLLGLQLLFVHVLQLLTQSLVDFAVASSGGLEVVALGTCLFL